jgi:hypothetical protein
MTSKLHALLGGLAAAATVAALSGSGCQNRAADLESAKPLRSESPSPAASVAAAPEVDAPAKTAPSKVAAAPVPAIPATATSPVGSEARRFPRPEDVPPAPMGETIGFSPVTQAKGYHPPDDPEADAVRTGRRVAKKVDIPFTGGLSSPEALAQAILDALRAEDVQALGLIRVTEKEFSEIMYPEFPESRPICNSDAATAFFFLDRTCHSGSSLGMTTWGRQHLELLGIEYAGGRSVYTNFTLYHGVHIHALNERGQEVVLKFARTFAERNGVWKVYGYKDKE